MSLFITRILRAYYLLYFSSFYYFIKKTLFYDMFILFTLKNEAKDEEIQLEGGSDEKKLLGGDKR